ncbi:uncharacterized protein LOC102803195 [Saccoglossus kowalevskii]|uniref:Uncharacterized protein LOC102803195 n=1 Tax=Saccoglossus kowalevskii TaxID=10224 RepID=A0ABM0MDZ8_SACKO|nr:PREDICTED: uncharacterized protein LOC102803195 [Saccoglossus kowalevskii]
MAVCRRSLVIFRLFFKDVCDTKSYRFCSSAVPSQPAPKLKDTLEDSSKSPHETLLRNFGNVMRRVPSPVIVLTTSNDTAKRGMTCSSFTSVSFKPPIISVCVHDPSPMHELLLKTQKFAINILAKDQAHFGSRFSKPFSENTDQFHKIPCNSSSMGLPILKGVAGVLECKAHHVHAVGDHHVWYGEVVEASEELTDEPLLYWERSYRSVGDEIFMKAFEETTLLFDDWDHAAHLRMAWNYIKQHGKDDATPLIKMGIKKYNEKNMDKIQRGYHETVTIFYIHLVADAIRKCNQCQPEMTFEEFLEMQSQLSDRRLVNQYYSPETINSWEASASFIPPDRKPLPK